MNREKQLEDGIRDILKTNVMPSPEAILDRLRYLIEEPVKYWPGQRIEYLHSETWQSAIFLQSFTDDYLICGQHYGNGRAADIRPIKDPSFSDYIPHDGGDICPLPDDVEIWVDHRNGAPFTVHTRYAVAPKFRWSDVKGFMVLCPGREDDS